MRRHSLPKRHPLPQNPRGAKYRKGGARIFSALPTRGHNSNTKENARIRDRSNSKWVSAFPAPWFLRRDLNILVLRRPSIRSRHFPLCKSGAAFQTSSEKLREVDEGRKEVRQWRVALGRNKNGVKATRSA